LVPGPLPGCRCGGAQGVSAVASQADAATDPGAPIADAVRGGARPDEGHHARPDAAGNGIRFPGLAAGDAVLTAREPARGRSGFTAHRRSGRARTELTRFVLSRAIFLSRADASET